MVLGLTSPTTLALLALLPLLSAAPIEPEPLHVLKVRKVPNRRDAEVRSDYASSIGFLRARPPPPPLPLRLLRLILLTSLPFLNPSYWRFCQHGDAGAERRSTP